jgi:hypothetical protein
VAPLLGGALGAIAYKTLAPVDAHG